MCLTKYIARFKRRIFRNRHSLSGNKIVSRQVHLEWWNEKDNIGDYLAVIVFNWMLNKKGISPDKTTHKIIHLMTIGSLIGLSDFDAVIWGAGIHCITSVNGIRARKKYVRYDVRALRGPITQHILENSGYICNCVMGDPAVLMPLIYYPHIGMKKYKYSVICHVDRQTAVNDDLHCISVKTHDYKNFINEILASECIISSSLHGIILAESYGVPAVFWNDHMENELMKYYDWYFSTGRMNVRIAMSIEEAVRMAPMAIPNLDRMRQGLLESFPYDLWM